MSNAAPLAVCAGLALSTWSGVCLLSALSPGLRATTGRAARLALGYDTGIELTALVAFAASVLGVRPGVGAIGSALLLAGAASAALARARARRGGRALGWRDALLPVLAAPSPTARAPRPSSRAERF